MVSQPDVTVAPRKGGAGQLLMLAAVVAGVFLHRLGSWGLLDASWLLPVLPTGIAGFMGIGGGVVCGLLPQVSFILTSARVTFDDGFRPGAVLVEHGRITRVSPLHPSDAQRDIQARARAAVRSGAAVVDYGSAVIGPGLVDVHVHMNEPGRVEWEGVETATKAAAAGGITTVVDMPLNNVPTTTTAALLRTKIAAVKGKAMVDVGFWGGMVPANSHNGDELRAMLAAGALGFKSFFSKSGIDDFPNAHPADVDAALPVLRAAGVPLLAHAELLDDDLPPITAASDRHKYVTFLEQRPKRFEAAAIEMLIGRLRAAAAAGPAAAPGFGIHIAHLGNADMLPAIAAAKAEGLPLTAEVNAHHLTWAAEDVPDGGTLFKCMPPLRDRGNLEALWGGLKYGTIDMLSSDHSPASPELKLMKSGDFLASWGGIAGLQYSLPAAVTGMAKRGIALERAATWWSAAPARLANLHRRKGRLAEGFDADVVVWDPEAAADTSAGGLFHRHKTTPYLNAKLQACP